MGEVGLIKKQLTPANTISLYKSFGIYLEYLTIALIIVAIVRIVYKKTLIKKSVSKWAIG